MLNPNQNNGKGCWYTWRLFLSFYSFFSLIRSFFIVFPHLFFFRSLCFFPFLFSVHRFSILIHFLFAYFVSSSSSSSSFPIFSRFLYSMLDVLSPGFTLLSALLLHVDAPPLTFLSSPKKVEYPCFQMHEIRSMKWKRHVARDN